MSQRLPDWVSCYVCDDEGPADSMTELAVDRFLCGREDRLHSAEAARMRSVGQERKAEARWRERQAALRMP